MPVRRSLKDQVHATPRRVSFVAFAGGDRAAIKSSLDLKRAGDLRVDALEALCLDPSAESIPTRRRKRDVLAQGRIRGLIRPDAQSVLPIVHGVGIDRDPGSRPIGDQLPAFQRLVDSNPPFLRSLTGSLEPEEAWQSVRNNSMPEIMVSHPFRRCAISPTFIPVLPHSIASLFYREGVGHVNWQHRCKFGGTAPFPLRISLCKINCELVIESNLRVPPKMPDLILPATVIGSWSFPGWFEKFAVDVKQNPDQFGPADRDEAVRDAVRLAIDDQLQAGLDRITDGEMQRVDFNLGFYEYLRGIEPIPHARRWGRPPRSARSSTRPSTRCAHHLDWGSLPSIAGSANHDRADQGAGPWARSHSRAASIAATSTTVARQ